MVEKSQHQGTIFVVDDDQGLLELLKIVLEDEKYKVLTASNAKDALKKLQTGVQGDLLSVDVLMIDNRMPGMTGIEGVRELQEKPQQYPLASGMRKVLMSATMQEDFTEKDIGLFDAFLPKPFELQKAVDMVEKLSKEPLID